MTDFLIGCTVGFMTFAFVVILWKWVKHELSGNWL